MPTCAVFTATILSSAIGTLAMALYAKKPFGLAPGMGINAFFVFGVLPGDGTYVAIRTCGSFLQSLSFDMYKRVCSFCSY